MYFMLSPGDIMFIQTHTMSIPKEFAIKWESQIRKEEVIEIRTEKLSVKEANINILKIKPTFNQC